MIKKYCKHDTRHTLQTKAFADNFPMRAGILTPRKTRSLLSFRIMIGRLDYENKLSPSSCKFNAGKVKKKNGETCSKLKNSYMVLNHACCDYLK